MKIILLKNLENLGSKGDVINIKNGYARNYLIPQAYAVLYTSKFLKNFNPQSKAKVTALDEVKLNDTTIIIAVKKKK